MGTPQACPPLSPHTPLLPPAGAFKAMLSPLTVSQLLNQEECSHTSKEGKPQCPRLPPVSLCACTCLTSLPGFGSRVPPAPAKLLPGPLGVLRPQEAWGVAHRLSPGPPRPPLLSAVVRGKVSSLGSASRGHRGHGVSWLVSVISPHFGQESKCLHVGVRRCVVVPSDGGPGEASLTAEVPWPGVVISGLDQGQLRPSQRLRPLSADTW